MKKGVPPGIKFCVRIESLPVTHYYCHCPLAIWSRIAYSLLPLTSTSFILHTHTQHIHIHKYIYIHIIRPPRIQTCVYIVTGSNLTRKGNDNRLEREHHVPPQCVSALSRPLYPLHINSYTRLCNDRVTVVFVKSLGQKKNRLITWWVSFIFL